MSKTDQTPTIDELQTIVSSLTNERNDLAEKLKTAESYKIQFEELSSKYSKLVETNMDLIRHIPISDQQVPEERRDVSKMSDSEKYAFLKELAQKSFEK